MKSYKIILGIETTCDETAVAIVQKKGSELVLLANVLSSSSTIQQKYGGVVPEQAAREQLKSINTVLKESLEQADCKLESIDAIAVSFGPGLIGSLLVGVEFAKTIALSLQKPLIPINHLLAHFYANWIDQNTPSFPCLGLLVSGGHTDLVLFTIHGKNQYLGGTLDDAAGECFDKCARILGLAYPGGPLLSKLARNGVANKFKLPRPLLNSGDLNFSFSGLKTAVLNLKPDIKTGQDKANLALEVEESITDVLVKKVALAVQKFEVEHIMVAGGVAANLRLRGKLQKNFQDSHDIYLPSLEFCTDNGAIVAAAAFYIGEEVNPLNLQANPNLSLNA